MRNYMQIQILDKADDKGGGGAGDESKERPPAKEGDASTEGDGDNLDELGYEKVKEEGEEKPKGDGKKKDPPEEEEIKDPATGYGEEPPKVEDDPPKDPPEGEKPPEPDDYDKALADLPKEEITKIKDFAKKHNVSVEIAKAFGEQRKAEIAAAVKAQKDAEAEYQREILKQRAAWHKELKEDRDFGGENFAKNIKVAEKILEEFMPSTKKRLTESKGVLPPYVMRDLAKMAKHLYATEKLVQGEPKTPGEEKVEKDDALDFYNS